jgi:hypothetical protein
MTGGGSHVFVDESKARGYIIAATVVPAEQVRNSRKALRGLLLKGQDRLHFAKESDSYRRSILSSMCALGFSIDVYVSSVASDKLGRERCLRTLLADVTASGVARLVLEQDDSLVTSDRRLIARCLAGCSSRPDYLHARSRGEPLLWVSDAAAWCWYRGGDWQRRLAPLVGSVRSADD